MCLLSLLSGLLNALWSPAPPARGRKSQTSHLLVQRVRALAQNYHPFGAYHLITGAVVRSIQLPKQGGDSASRIGNSAYADQVQEQLDVKRIWKNLYGTKGK